MFVLNVDDMLCCEVFVVMNMVDFEEDWLLLVVML